MPKCPVCKSEVHTGSTECCVCGFTELHAVFLNIEEAEIWQKQVVEPCKAIWQRSAQNSYRKMGKFEVVGTTLIKYNYNHLDATSFILIPYGITTISSWAFNGVRAGYVIVPNSVTTIENFAFGNSTIEHLYIPNSVKHIGIFAVGKREGTNVYLDFAACDPNWGQYNGTSFGFNRSVDWGSPFYDWKKFEKYVADSDFTGIYDNVRCYWKNEWIDVLYGDSNQSLCLPSKKELVIANRDNITIVYNGYSLGEGITTQDEDGEDVETTGLYIWLLINNRTNCAMAIDRLSFDGMDLECQNDAIIVEPNSFNTYCLRFWATNEDDSDYLLELDTPYPEIPDLRFSFNLRVAGEKIYQYDCDFSRLNNINAPGTGLYIGDLEEAIKQNYSI